MNIDGSLNSAGSCRRNLYFLASWILGLIAGTLFAAEAEHSFVSMMRLAASSRVSIAALLLSAVLPFLITAFAVFINRYPILYIAALWKGFFFSCCAGFIFGAYGSAGWLVQPLLQFTRTVLSTVFCWFCIRRCCAGIAGCKKDLAVCLIISALTVMTDSLLVAPFLGSLMDF